MQWRPNSESAWLPTVLQTVPIADPNWAHDKVNDDWKRVHFINCFKEGLKKILSEAIKLLQTIRSDSVKGGKSHSFSGKAQGGIEKTVIWTQTP